MANYTIRKNCVICNFELIKLLFDIDLNISCNPSMKDNNITDVIIPYNINICENCGIYQNKYLGDITIVYNKSHNNILISEVWKNHYNNLYNFIENNKILLNYYKILEIGGGNNYLAELFIKKYKNYSILEPNVSNKNKEINYIEEWMETYNHKNDYDIIILSHVLEHLYNPSELFKFKSKYICISIPNMPKYVKNKFINVLNIEHTYHFEEIHIINLFLQNNYKLINIEYYLEHSIFMIFKYENNEISKNIIYENTIKDNINNNFYIFFKEILKIKDNINELQNNNLNTEYAVFPCNHYIQYLITFGLNVTNIKYLYDNNIEKFNKILYGTNLICKNLDFFINSNITIILIGNLYNNEIIKNLKNNEIKYIIY
jgi:hypothetical protein